MKHLDHHSLLLFSGKGGVGKTTLAASVALHYAQTKRVLLCQVNGSDPVGEWFDVAPHRDGDPRPITHNLDWCNIMTDLALKEYALLKLRSKIIYKMIFERGKGASFALGIPGFSELIIWGKIRYHHQQKQKGRKRYDLIIVDLPATGDLMPFLNFPRGIQSVLKRGPVAREIDQLAKWLYDKSETTLCWVTDGNNLSLQEYQAFRALFQDARIPPGSVVLNGYVPRRDLPQRDQLPQLLEAVEAIYHQKLQRQKEVIAYFSEEAPLVTLPRLDYSDKVTLLTELGVLLYD